MGKKNSRNYSVYLARLMKINFAYLLIEVLLLAIADQTLFSLNIKQWVICLISEIKLLVGGLRGGVRGSRAQFKRLQ